MVGLYNIYLWDWALKVSVLQTGHTRYCSTFGSDPLQQSSTLIRRCRWTPNNNNLLGYDNKLTNLSLYYMYGPFGLHCICKSDRHFATSVAKAIKKNRQTNHTAVKQKTCCILSENGLNGRSKFTLMINHSSVLIFVPRSSFRDVAWYASSITYWRKPMGLPWVWWEVQIERRFE